MTNRDAYFNPQVFKGDKNRGITTRDWFAGMAMMGILSNIEQYTSKYQTEDVARLAYNQADEMVKEFHNG